MQDANSTFDTYTILEPIGKGGMAIVYKAKTKDGQTVALKVLADNLAMDEDMRVRFEREARIMSQLNHRGIVRAFDHGVYNNRPYLAMEYMPLGSLDQYFKQGVRVTIGQSLKLLHQIADALDYAHSQIDVLHKQPVIHRDLKIDNILMDYNHRVALSDFGLARMQDDTRMSVSGVMMGTLMYISPEQIRSFKHVDYRTDLYAFGVIAYVLLTGHFPFVGTTYEEYIMKHLNQLPPNATDLNSNLPVALDGILARAIAKEPEDRYPSAKAFVQAVTHVLHPVADLRVEIVTSFGEDTKVSPINFSQILDQQTPSQPKRRFRKALMVLAVVIVLMTLAALFVVSQSSTTRSMSPRVPPVSFNQGS